MIGTKYPKALNSFLHSFPWIHIGIGIAGNAAFVIGSAMFLIDAPQAGVFFVAGSIGMLIGSVGYLFVQIEDRRLRNQGFDPQKMATLRKPEIPNRDPGDDG